MADAMGLTEQMIAPQMVSSSKLGVIGWYNEACNTEECAENDGAGEEEWPWGEERTDHLPPSLAAVTSV